MVVLSTLSNEQPTPVHVNLAAHLTIIDEVSTSTTWMANRASVTLQPISVCHGIEFGGESNSVIEDILQSHLRRPFF
jgi:hypothetical protein